MSDKPTDSRPTGLSKSRLESLVDGIFGFAMTLLVANIEIPHPAKASPVQLLSNLHPDFLQYFTAFLVLSGFWVVHHQQFSYLKAIDARVLWMNILGLLMVALMPFSTELADSYMGDHVAVTFFGGNIFLIGLIFYLQWKYATLGRRLVDPGLESRVISEGSWINTIIPGISLAVIALSLLDVPWSFLLYFSIPIILAILRVKGVGYAPED